LTSATLLLRAAAAAARAAVQSVRRFAATGALAAVALAPMGAEFRVDSYTAKRHTAAQVAAADDGSFVVVWSARDEGSEYEVFARLFDGEGTPRGGEFAISAHQSGSQIQPVPAILDQGRFIVAWSSFGQDGDNFGVFARRFDHAGVPLAVEFQVNAYTPNEQLTPALAANADGDTVITWSSQHQDGAVLGVFGRLFDGAGIAQGREFQVNVSTTHNEARPDVDIDDQGAFVVSWGAGNSVFARRFDSAAAPVSADFRVNTSTTDDHGGASVSLDQSGSFLLTWGSFGQDGSANGVFARRFGADGSPQATEFQINVTTLSLQLDPSLTMGPDGDFVVAWASYSQDGGGLGVFARTFETDGTPTSGELQVNSYTPGDQSEPRIAMDGDGDMVVTWRTLDEFRTRGSVFAQRYAGPTLDVDEDAEVASLTDGVLILRFLFGFTEEALTPGAVDLASCQRCSNEAVAAHLATIAPSLDVDGNGEALALTDGILVLRWLFGFTGTVLVGNAVDLVNCTRCTASSIEAYLETLR
jgi:hypothetical protein